MTDRDQGTSAKTSSGADRRTLLRSAGAAGGAVAAAAALAACGGSSGASDGAAPASAAGAASSAGGGSSAAGGAGAGKGIAASKVPVGSGIIDNDLQAVVTQPTKGEFKAFSYICTHQGCPVTQISGDTIICPCHGSEFSTKDGSVKQGPATTPLTPKTATLKGTQVVVG